MKRFIARLTIGLALVVAGATGAVANEQVCSGEKFDVEELPVTTADGVVITLVDADTVNFDLPDNAVSATVCLKAGSANQEEGGPEEYVLLGDTSLDHSTGKDLSHVSVIDVIFEEEPSPSPTPEPTPSPEPTPEPEPSPTPEPPVDKPDKPDKPEQPDTRKPLPVTGIEENLLIAAGILALAGGATVWFTRRRRVA